MGGGRPAATTGLHGVGQSEWRTAQTQRFSRTSSPVSTGTGQKIRYRQGNGEFSINLPRGYSTTLSRTPVPRQKSVAEHFFQEILRPTARRFTSPSQT